MPQHLTTKDLSPILKEVDRCSCKSNNVSQNKIKKKSVCVCVCVCARARVCVCVCARVHTRAFRNELSSNSAGISFSRNCV
jgi:hypothetical protein